MGASYTETVFAVNRHYTNPVVHPFARMREYAEMAFKENLVRLREAKGWRQEDLAQQVEVAQETVSRWETGAREPRGKLRAKLAAALDVSEAELYAGHIGDDIVPAGPSLFVKGKVQAGYFVDSWEVPEDEWERYTGRADIAVAPNRRFGLRVVGESMNEIYPPGTILDCVVWEGNDPIANGKRVIVRRKRHGDGLETTVKEYFKDADGVEWLVPRSHNPAFQAPFRCDEPGDDIEYISIIAIVVASLRPE